MSIIVTQINRLIVNALVDSIERCYDDIGFQKEYYIKYSNIYIYIYSNEYYILYTIDDKLS